MESLTLTFREGPRAGSSVAAACAFETVGRTARKASMVVHDPSVSERHAELSWRAGRWHVRDVGSSNGTWLNGRALEPCEGGHGSDEGWVELRDGDELLLGTDSLAEVVVAPTLPPGTTEDDRSVEQMLEEESQRLQERIRARGERAKNQLLEAWQEKKTLLLQAGERVRAA